MKNRYVLLFILTFTLCTIITGCGNSNADGKYNIEEINRPENMDYTVDLEISSEGSLLIGGAGRDSDGTNTSVTPMLYMLNEDAKWEKIFENKFEVEGTTDRMDSEVNIFGKHMFFTTMVDTGNNIRELYYYKSLTKDSAEKIFQRDDSIHSVITAEFTSKQIGYAIDFNKNTLVQIDIENEKVNDIELETVKEISDIIMCNDKIYIMGCGTTVYNTENMREEKADEDFTYFTEKITEKGDIANDKVMTAVGDGDGTAFFYVNREGIWKYSHGTEESLLKAEDRDVFNDAVFFSSITAKNTEDIYVTAAYEEGERLYHISKKA